ncbi:MAG: DNA recombination protein RmuC, partial [bacterium]
MLYVLIGVCGIAVGAVVAWLCNRSSTAVLAERLSERDRQLQQADAALKEAQAASEARADEITSLKARTAELAITLEEQRKAADERLASVRSAVEERMAAAEKAAQEKLALLEDARQKLLHAFQALSAEALKSNSEAFLQLARQTLENQQLQAKGDLEKRQQAIEQMVKPLADSLTKVDQQIQEMEK